MVSVDVKHHVYLLTHWRQALTDRSHSSRTTCVKSTIVEQNAYTCWYSAERHVRLKTESQVMLSTVTACFESEVRIECRWETKMAISAVLAKRKSWRGCYLLWRWRNGRPSFVRITISIGSVPSRSLVSRSIVTIVSRSVTQLNVSTQIKNRQRDELMHVQRTLHWPI